MVKKDIVKKIDDTTFSFTLFNARIPLRYERLQLAPTGNVLDYLTAKINGEELTMEELENIEIHMNDQNVKFSNFQDLDVVGIGQEVTFVFKSDKLNSVNDGDEITIEVNINDPKFLPHLISVGFQPF